MSSLRIGTGRCLLTISNWCSNRTKRLRGRVQNGGPGTSDTGPQALEELPWGPEAVRPYQVYLVTPGLGGLFLRDAARTYASQRRRGCRMWNRRRRRAAMRFSPQLAPTVDKADAEPRSIPVFAASAFATKLDTETMRELGCEACLTKPITMTSFIEAVDAALR